MHKVLAREELLSRRAGVRAAGRTLVHCHGCFDLLHPGHIRHLKQARAMGDLLLVSVTADAHVGKGPGRPLIPQELRAETLAALEFVDWVYIDPHATAAELLRDLAPDVYVKGPDYRDSTDIRFHAERATVEARGGRVAWTGGDVVFSSSALIAGLGRVSPASPLPSGRPFEALAAARGARIVIVGDAILDTYVFCERATPDNHGTAPTLRPRGTRTFDGGGAVIARHAAAMGARPVLVTALPADAPGAAMRRRLEAEGIEVRSVRTPLPVAEKQRFFVGGQKVLKIDPPECRNLDTFEQHRLLDAAADAARDADAAIVADFGQGLLAAEPVARLFGLLRPRVRVLAGDVSGPRSSLRRMRHADLLAPNEWEARAALGAHDEPLRDAACQLLEQTQAAAAFITQGEDGLTVFAREARDGGGLGLPALCRVPVDPLGCGDALLTAATLALAGGASLAEAAHLGSIAAAVQAARLGNTAVSAADLRAEAARVGVPSGPAVSLATITDRRPALCHAS